MPERTVAVSVVANMSNYLAGMQRGSTATAGLGKQAQTSGELTRAFVGKIGNSITSLGNQVGGTVGAVLDTLGNGIDKVSSKSAHLATAFEVGGGAAVAAGIGLQQLGSSAVQATDQLNATITSTGDSVSDYTKRIDEAVASGEDFGRSAEDTKAALTALIPAAGSTSKALDLMQVVTNLAAAKHESLATAGTAVARVLGGNGSRTLSVYGIQMDGVGTKTQQGTRALAQLEDKLNGQASAAVNNFGGQVGIITTKLGDFVNDAANPAGIALTAAGGAATATGFILDIFKNRAAKAAAAQTALNVAAAESVVPLDAEAVSATANSGALAKMGSGLAALATGPAGLVVVAAGALYATSAIETMTDAAANNTLKIKSATAASKDFAKQLALDPQTGIGAQAPKDPRAQALNFTNGAAGSIGQFFASVGLAGINPQYESATASITKIDDAMAGLVKSGNAKEAAAEFTKWQVSAQQNGITLSSLDKQFPAYTASIKTYGGAVGDAGTTTDVLAGRFGVAAQNAAFLKDTTDELEKSLAKYGTTAQTAEGATESYYSALDAATAAVKANGKNIDDQTAKGRANNAALYGLASAADAVATANLKANVPIGQVNASLEKAKSQFISVAEQMGYTKTAAEQLAAKLVGVTTTKYKFTLDGVTVATNNLNDYIKALNKIPGSVTTSFKLNGTTTRASANGNLFDYGGRAAAFANGGFPSGIYGGRSGGIQKFAEPETGWELYVSGKPSQRARNQSLLMQGAARLGMLGGSPAPVYQPSRASSGSTTVVSITVPVTVSAGVVADKNQLAQVITSTVREGVRNGTISKDWINRA